MKKSSLMGLIAVLSGEILFSGCATKEVILRKGDKFGDYEIGTIHNSVLNDKEYFVFELKKDHVAYPVEIDGNGIGKTFIQGTNYAVRIYRSDVSEKRKVGLTPIERK